MFEEMAGLVQDGIDAGAFAAGDAQRRALLMSATVQGIAALVGSGRVPEAVGAALLDDAVALFTAARP